MATAHEIRSQIAARKRELQQEKEETERAYEEIDGAQTRQKLRRELEQIDSSLSDQRDSTTWARDYRKRVDHDQSGPFLCEEAHHMKGVPASIHSGEVAKGVVDCGAHVVDGEIDWSIKGFRWLKDTLKQNGEAFVRSPEISVGGHTFSLVYHPRRGTVGCGAQRASLAINHEESCDYEGVVFRYTILIKSKERGYVQWGKSCSICTNNDADDMLFGPDVVDAPGIPSGIFGLRHRQLMESEWVIDDALTAKLKVQVRPKVLYDTKSEIRERRSLVMPCSNLIDNLLALLDTGVGSDVTFQVQGDIITAHSQILCARSEVLQRQFSCGMQESTSKEVFIDDCEPVIFKSFLRYLYCDDFATLEGLISNKDCGTPMSMLQKLLAISHKYQVTRLQAWCESKLCELITIDEVCSVLQQAHLYEVKTLEQRCLDFIADNMSEVAKTETFASLIQQWPEVSLKITLRVARVSELNAEKALKAQESLRKRKRSE